MALQLLLLLASAAGASAAGVSAVTCSPVHRPPAPSAPPTVPRAARPHIVTIIVDDLGFDDTQLHNTEAFFTPQLGKLKAEGIMLQRHHVFMWCSPTRRSFLTGRLPVHIGSDNPQACSNDLPLQFEILPEKLRAAEYESHFVGKGHLGYQTVDHLPVNRGFASHVGFLAGMEGYKEGDTPAITGPQPGSVCHHDMFFNAAPLGDARKSEVFYSTNFYTSQALSKIQQRNTSRPFWLHLCYQAVHSGADPMPPEWERIPPESSFRSQLYGSMIAVADSGIGNVTASLKQEGLWANTILLITADNGGDCEHGNPDKIKCENKAPGYAQGNCGMASNYPLLGRKCTPFEGGTRAAALLAGGLIKPSLRGTDSELLIHISDWYVTFAKLAGIDPTDTYTVNGATHPVDGLDVWSAIMSQQTSATATKQRWLPTTESSILLDDDSVSPRRMWKLFGGALEGSSHRGALQANRFLKNGTNYPDPFNACLPGETVEAPTGFPRDEAKPTACAVCSDKSPCLFEVLSDPSETKNLAKAANQTIKLLIEKMATKLKSYKIYLPALTPSQLACYNCLSPKQWNSHWKGWAGPCCLSNSSIVMKHDDDDRDDAYTITVTRANGRKPFISSHADQITPNSVFNFNLVPVFLTLPDGQPALIVRSVNGTSYAGQPGDHTASTLVHPDQITLTTFVNNASDDPDSIKVQPITDASIVFPPLPLSKSKAEACGVQDPRVVKDPKTGMYVMTYAAYANPLPYNNVTNPKSTFCGDAWLGLATTKTPQVASSWVRHGYNCGQDDTGKGKANCGKSAAILVRDKPPHFMFFGIPTIGISTSDDLINWKLINSSWLTPQKLPAGCTGECEMWIEAGSPPMKLPDGNYLMSYNIAAGDLHWGTGFLILDGTDPTKVLMRKSHMLFPGQGASLDWEWANGTAGWEPYKNCIGAMNSLHALPATPEERAAGSSRFVGYYAAGDAVSGAAVITVTSKAKRAVLKTDDEAPPSELEAWGVTFEPPVAIGSGGAHDGCQGFGGQHMVSGSRCTSDGAKSWGSCKEAYGFVPPTGAILRINASGPTGPSTEIRNMGLQWGDYIDMAAFNCKLKSQRDHAAPCNPQAQWLCNNFTNFYAEGPPRFNESVKSARLTSDGKVVKVKLPAGSNRRMIFDGMEERNIAFTCGSDCTGSGHRAQAPGKFGCPFWLSGRGITRRADGVYVQTLITYLLPGTAASPGLGAGNENGPFATSVVAFSSTDGWHWSFLSVVLTPSDPVASNSEEGPNECDIAVLADGKTLMAVIRVDGGDGQLPGAAGMLAHAHSPYVSAKSTDGGNSWQKERMKPSTNDGRQLGCARPRLMSFGKGAPLVMSGGRNLVAVPPPANGAGAFAHEPRLWVNSKGDGGDFTAISISYVHNALVANASLKFSAKVNSTLKESTSYTSLMWSGKRSGVLTYDAGHGRHCGRGEHCGAFSMRFKLKADDESSDGGISAEYETVPAAALTAIKHGSNFRVGDSVRDNYRETLTGYIKIQDLLGVLSGQSAERKAITCLFNINKLAWKNTASLSGNGISDPEDDIQMLLVGLSKHYARISNGFSHDIQDLLGELGGASQSGSLFMTLITCGRDDGNNEVSGDSVDIQDVLSLLSGWIEDSNEIQSDDNVEPSDSDGHHDTASSTEDFVRGCRRPSQVDCCIIGFVIYLVYLVTMYCDGDNQKRHSRPEVCVPGRHTLPGIFPFCGKGRRQCWALAKFRKALRKWRQDSGPMRCQRSNVVLGMLLLFVLLFQPVAEGSAAAAQNVAVSTNTVDQQPNLDMSQLAQLDIDPVLLQFIGNVVIQLQVVEAKNAVELARVQNRTHIVEAQLEQVTKDKAALETKTEIVEAELRHEKVKVHDLQTALLELSNRMNGDVQNITLRLDQCEVDTHPFIKEMQTLQRRKMQEEDTLCRGTAMIAMFAACCPSQGGGHRRFMQSVQGCDALPSTCSADCAPLFIGYFEGCQGIIDDLAPDQRLIFVGFYSDCNEVEQAAAAMLEDARPAMIFHVVVMSEAEARQAQIFGGGNAPAQPVGPIGPLPPSPSPAGVAEIAQEFRQVCTTANLTVCVPQCNRLTYGFLLSIEIDGRGTVMTCNVIDMMYAWVGQASLGGYIGEVFAAFFSSVISGAAGTYMVKMTRNETVHTDLTIEPGQVVVINGGRALLQAPTWGSGGFTVGESASLSLNYMQIDTVIQMNEGASQLTLDSCELTFSATMVLRAAKVTFANVLHFAGGVTVSEGTSLTTAGSSLSLGGLTVASGAVLSLVHTSLSFARAGLVVLSDGHVAITDSSVSCAAGVRTGLAVQQGGTATATGSAFRAADGATAVAIREGGHFEVADSQLVDADGTNEAFVWLADVALCECGGHGDRCVGPLGDCECEPHGVVDGTRYPGPWTGARCEVQPPTNCAKCCSNSGCGCDSCCGGCCRERGECGVCSGGDTCGGCTLQACGGRSGGACHGGGNCDTSC